MKDLVIAHPDQAWVADITYVQLQVEGVYPAVLLDVFTHAMRGWQLSRSLDQDLTLTALRRALETHRAEIHPADQGLQYASTIITSRSAWARSVRRRRTVTRSA